MAGAADLGTFTSGRVYTATELHVEPVIPAYRSGTEPPRPPETGRYEHCRMKVEHGLVFVLLDEPGHGHDRVDMFPISRLRAVIGLRED